MEQGERKTESYSARKLDDSAWMSILRKKTGHLVKVSSWSQGGEGKKQNKIKLKLSRDKDYVSV